MSLHFAFLTWNLWIAIKDVIKFAPLPYVTCYLFLQSHPHATWASFSNEVETVLIKVHPATTLSCLFGPVTQAS